MKGVQLLLADDNELSMKLMKVIFEAEGYTTFSAKDGAEAMTILLREKIDLIVTDILMPNVDGYYLCYKVRLHEQLKNIPIIVYSGTFTSQSEEKIAKEMGANLFIRKPAPKDILISSVKELLTVPQNINPNVTASAESFEVMHQYSSSLIDKLEHRNILLEDAKQNLERIVEKRTQELKNTVEELQATNEEFEAANEELLAANEELATLNDQLAVASEVIEKQTQIIISRKDEQLSRIYDTVNDIIFVIDVEKVGHYKMASVNKAFEIASGQSANDVVGKDLEEITDPETFDNVLEKYKQAITEKKIVKWEQTTEFLAGKRTGEVTVAPVFDENGVCIQLIGVMYDITERKKFEEKLSLSEARLKEAQAIAHVGNWELDFVNNVQSWSDELYSIYGLKKGEVPPTVETFLLFMHPDDADFAAKEIAKASSSLTDASFNYRYLRKDGEVRHGYAEWRFEIDASGKPSRLYGIMQDVTEMKHAEEKIRENEKRFRDTLDGMIEGCQIIDFNWYYVYVNPSAAMQGQKKPEDLVGRTMMDAYPGIEKSHLFSVLKKCMSQRTGAQFENEFNLPDGDIGWFDIRIQPSPEGLFIISNDISSRKESEKALEEYNERYEIVSKATNDAIWDWDILLDSEKWNYGMQSIFGYKELEIGSSKSWWKEKIKFEDYNRVQNEIEDAFKMKATNWVSQYQFLCADGSYKHVLDRAYIIYQSDKPVRMIGAMQDITEVVEYRQNLERMVEERTYKLNEALNKEKELVELKSKFVSIASHEFRTPLTTIALTTGFIKKYKSKLGADDLDKKLVDIEKQVSHMTYLLDDVLMIGKAEAGKIHVNLKEISLDFFETLAKQVVKSSKTGHKLKFENECKTHSMMSDEKLMRNIVINLLTNAMKFSPGKKEVLMNIRCDKKNILITVKDSGIGIPPWDIKNLFTSFSRGSNVGAIEGTGLGLSIVKKAIDLLNGTIEVKSKIKKGTEFIVTLPLHHA